MQIAMQRPACNPLILRKACFRVPDCTRPLRSGTLFLFFSIFVANSAKINAETFSDKINVRKIDCRNISFGPISAIIFMEAARVMNLK
jgi:hypothetical protein